MKTKVYIGVAIRIIIVFALPMFLSFATESMHGFFGDKIGAQKSEGVFINDGYSWGARHYWFFWMTLLLWILSVVNAIIGAINLVNKNYDI